MNRTTRPAARRLLALALVLVLCPLLCGLAGCASADESVEEEEAETAAEAPDEAAAELPAEAAGQPPTYHLWDDLYRAGDEAEGYGMYTYVLTNRHAGEGADEAFSTRYAALVDAIIRTTPHEDLFSEFDPAYFNLFLIPRGTPPVAPSGAAPGDEGEALAAVLSMHILTGISLAVDDESLRRRISANPGPFLVSALEPISTLTGGEVDLLYVDLSGTNVAAMEEVVAAYKTRISDRELDGFERFNPVRLAILDFILDANDHVRLVKTASAQWLDDEEE